jgi:DNA-binding NarL/FixJ family response regulator
MHSEETALLPINLLIIDDHKVVRDGLKMMLASLKKVLIFKVTEAGSGEDALKKISRDDFGLVIIDYQLPGISGVETIYRILRYKPSTKIMVLSHYDELPCIQAMMDAGARAYVLKSVEPAELHKALIAVLSGSIYYSNVAALKMIESGRDNGIQQLQAKSLLTRREQEVLKMIAMELTNDEIAQKLSVAKRTIDTHRQNLINKLHVKNTVGLVKAAYKLNLISS